MVKKWFLIRLLIVNIIIKLMDVMSTLYVIYLYGPEIEFNPFTANMIYAYGPQLGLAVNFCIHSMLIFLLYLYGRKQLLGIAAILTALFPIVNLIDAFIAGG